MSERQREKEEEERRARKRRKRMLAVLVVINHGLSQYPLPWVLFDLDRSKMEVLK